MKDHTVNVEDGGTTVCMYASQRLELRNPSSHICYSSRPVVFFYSDKSTSDPHPYQDQWRARWDLNPRPVPEARDDSPVHQVKSLLRYLSAPRAPDVQTDSSLRPSMTSYMTQSPIIGTYGHAWVGSSSVWAEDGEFCGHKRIWIKQLNGITSRGVWLCEPVYSMLWKLISYSIFQS